MDGVVSPPRWARCLGAGRSVLPRVHLVLKDHDTLLTELYVLGNRAYCPGSHNMLEVVMVSETV